MHISKFKLNKNNSSPFEILRNESETNALIRITKSRHCKALSIVLQGKDSNTPKTLAAKTYNQVDLTGYFSFTVAADLVSEAEAFVEGEIYTGTWEEMILVEAELSFSSSPFYISCSNEQVEFMIGAPEETRMEVKPAADGSFSIVTTIVHPSVQVPGIENSIADDTEASQVIKRLYGRMKGRINGQGFAERQAGYKEAYTQNFNATVLEGYHPAE